MRGIARASQIERALGALLSRSPALSERLVSSKPSGSAMKTSVSGLSDAIADLGGSVGDVPGGEPAQPVATRELIQQLLESDAQAQRSFIA